MNALQPSNEQIVAMELLASGRAQPPRSPTFRGSRYSAFIVG
jgi:hypothetical protein